MTLVDESVGSSVYDLLRTIPVSSSSTEKVSLKN
jgi:hypothetical protein